MCKHYNTPQGCSYGDKCQFAHGAQELRTGQMGMSGMGDLAHSKNQKNPLNYKIVKCKNFERDGSCKYGAHCTFAHGDSDLRTKADNYSHFQQGVSMGQPGMIPPFMLDYNMMPQQLGMGFDMNQMGQLGMGGQLDPNAMMMGMSMNPNMGMNNMQGMDMGMIPNNQNIPNNNQPQEK